MMDLNGIGTVVYRAEKANPYELKEGVLAGVYYSEAYAVKDSLETAKRVGAVGLRAEVVRYQLQKAKSPSENAIFPLPFDPTLAPSFSDQSEQGKENRKIVVQDTRNTVSGIGEMFIKVPVGSPLITPIEQKPDTSVGIRLSKQSWGTAIYIGTEGIFTNGKDKYSLLAYYGSWMTFDRPGAILGETIDVVYMNSFSSGLLDVYRDYRDPLPVSGMNVDLQGKLIVQDADGILQSVEIQSWDILAVNGSFVFVLANGNPLLSN
jgi:hypothetical protein